MKYEVNAVITKSKENERPFRFGLSKFVINGFILSFLSFYLILVIPSTESFFFFNQTFLSIIVILPL